MKDSTKEDIARFTRLISDTEEKAKARYDEYDLTPTQISYLETIHELNNPNITELAAALGLKKPSVTLVVDRLITKGCIYKTHSDADRRSSHLHLTDLGTQINKRHDSAHDYLIEFITGKLTKEEFNTFSLLLSRIINS